MLHRREVFLGALAACFSAVRAYADAPSDEAIHVMLQERVGIDRESTGIVAVVSDSAGSRLSAYGRAGTAGNRPLDGDTVFEIGSITKVLTALILADMVERSEVAMTDPVAKYLPASKVPEFQGKPITLLDLARQSGAARAATPACRYPNPPDRHRGRLQGRPADPIARRFCPARRTL
jgi:D-alanyl-D-alanine-carboxypeptidase/D-alanyl-D-alanine-endopeptidase